jgi:NhaA family Na+:H+ antiporter
MPLSAIREFLKLESAGGILLVIAAALALILSNSPLAPLYDAALHIPVGVRLGELALEKSLLHWINDGLMAVFFFLVGLEIKREVLDGELSTPRQIALPGLAALGGMAAPALIYVLVNRDMPENLVGWAIPAATDIAFALGVLGLVGSRAILDDLGAIVIIAIFFTADLSLVSLGLAGAAILALAILNRCGVTRLAPYALIGVFLWVCVLKSGVHATLAGVALAFAIPLKAKEGEESPLRQCEHALHPWVAFGIMPVFAFANAGVSLAGLGFGVLLQPVALGTMLGLFLGKQIGVMGMTVLGTRLGLCRLPEGASWMQMYGVALLTGIGFTMSLFIGTLAFSDPAYGADVRVGVLSGSLLSAVLGFLLLRFAPASSARDT